MTPKFVLFTCDKSFKTEKNFETLKFKWISIVLLFVISHLCHILFFNKVSGLRPAALLKRGSDTSVYCEFSEIYENTFFTEHLLVEVDLNIVIRTDSLEGSLDRVLFPSELEFPKLLVPRLSQIS